MKRTKLQKFTELKSFDNVLEYTSSAFIKNVEKLLSSNNYICLELGCGNGDFSIELAKQNPDKLYIGIDIQGERLWYGSKRATAEKITNVFFIRMFIDSIDELIPTKSINEIWITFPDPYSKKSKANKRLTSQNFLDKYKKILKQNGVINFKTDDKDLFEFTIEEAKSCSWTIVELIEDVHNMNTKATSLEIKTKFEQKWIELGKKIYYLKFTSV
ncbi:tRNA (guanosine(46)-N7)-methyltransferase TrmB [Candidatus Dojkabacteria bacterium]|uniref:tRNA (guanine-N(7)-)-methyltransferase n=1 Tax=Candidatus Dojkabacteria bacterium TaxID=2099670 RepID=A0A955ICH4_9BACT|nr:tRNA (guanosine(46)-N7)-methyltransferase TrmB [Candidatus Dojkabacteria bacterium]